MRTAEPRPSDALRPALVRALFSIRTKFAVLSFVIVLVPIYLLNRQALKGFDAFTSRALEEEMISHARFLGEQYRMLLQEEPDAARGARFQAMLERLGPQLQSRLRLLSDTGVVLYDSGSTEASIGTDLSTYREVARAATGSYGARWQMTADSSFVYYYIAVPVCAEDGRVLAIAHVMRHTGPIIRTIIRMQHEQDLMLTLALVSALVMSWIVAQTLTRRLRRLTARSREFVRTGKRLPEGVGGRDEIAELGRALSRMTGTLDRRSAYNREFVEDVMHELKSPFTAIRGAAEVLESGAAQNPEACARFLGNIRFQVDRVSRLTGELAELTKLENELACEPFETVDYLEALRRIRDRLPLHIEGEHAPVSFDLPDVAEPIRVGISTDRLEQILVNLIDNAIRYTPPDGTITVGVALTAPDEVCTTVHDTGAGISESNLPKVFSRFFTTKRKGEAGSGLGLAIVTSILERHHGHITVSSRPGAGTTFCFTFPTV